MDYSLLVGIEQDSKHTNILKHNRFVHSLVYVWERVRYRERATKIDRERECEKDR